MASLVIAARAGWRHAFNMKIQRDGRRTFMIEVVRFWLGENGKLLILLVSLTTIAILCLVWLSRQYAAPGVYEEAELVRFGGRSFYDGDHLLVVVRTQDGRVWTLRANAPDVLYCHAGSRIRLVRHGTGLTLAEPSCAP
jgi:hypothetical protein